MPYDTSKRCLQWHAFPYEVYAMTDFGVSRWTHPAVILVATDLSDLDRLMPFALHRRPKAGARLILLHAIASSAAMSVDAVGMPYYDPSAALAFAEKELKPWCEAARRHNIACDALVREGHAMQQIATAARQFQADRILLGTRSRGRLGRCCSVPLQNKCCARSTSRSLPWDPRLISRWKASDEERVVLHATTLRETSRPSAALACQMADS